LELLIVLLLKLPHLEFQEWKTLLDSLIKALLKGALEVFNSQNIGVNRGGVRGA
jgi:hypothetical protein